MAQIDDLKVLIAEVAESQVTTAGALTDLAADVDKLLELVTTPGVDLGEVIQSAAGIRDTARALAVAATEAAAKYDSTSEA